MKISELIDRLETLRRSAGDMEVFVGQSHEPIAGVFVLVGADSPPVAVLERVSSQRSTVDDASAADDEEPNPYAPYSSLGEHIG